MRRRRSLRFRVAFAFAVLSAGLSLVFALGIWTLARDQAQRLLDQTLAAELDDYMGRRARNPESLPPDTASLRGFVLPLEAGRPVAGAPGAPPPEVGALGPGQHEVVLDGVPYRVGVADRGERRYYLLFDEQRQRARERRFAVTLLVGVALTTLLAALGGAWLAARAIAPVSDLARAVARASAASPPRLDTDDLADDEIGELTRAFDRYFARIGAFVERERAFAADASHELRTPLAVISGAAEVLVEDPALDENQAARVARIERAAAEMSALISALLLLAREDGPPADPRDAADCDAAEVVRSVVDRYRPVARRRRIAIGLEVGAPVRLAVAPALFSIVVANLVRNAVTHTDGGTVDVRLSQDRLTVTDAGPGIDETEADLLFQRYYRGAASSGSGIGLSLVKRICDRQRWRVQLENRAGGGTIAELRFDDAA